MPTTIDYSKISHYYEQNLNQLDWDIVVIVPAYNRQQFNNIFISTMLAAIKKSDKCNIHLVLVEFCDGEQALKHHPAPHNIISHIAVYKSDITPTFNKCLLHNIGAFYFNKAHNFLFHDIDVIVPIDFFNKIQENWHSYNALQTYNKQRLLQLNETTTQHLLNGNLTVPIIFKENLFTENKEGAPGGSILVCKDLFFNIGGYDADSFTEYSIEDQMFFDKVKLFGNLGFCNNPAIELLHCYHEPSFSHIVKDADRKYYDEFNQLNDAEKKRMIDWKAFLFKKELKEFL